MLLKGFGKTGKDLFKNRVNAVGRGPVQVGLTSFGAASSSVFGAASDLEKRDPFFAKAIDKGSVVVMPNRHLVAGRPASHLGATSSGKNNIKNYFN